MSEKPSVLAVIRHDQQAYPESVTEQEMLVADILKGAAISTLILTSHPAIYTLGTSAQTTDILHQQFGSTYINTHRTGRGGEVTYHGPGQLLCYVIADLRQQRDLHHHVWRLEEMVIKTLTNLNIASERSSRGIGVWIKDKKIAAVGVRCRKWIVFHGVALNINPNLQHFTGIIPCGMHDQAVTSISNEGVNCNRNTAESFIIQHAKQLFSA